MGSATYYKHLGVEEILSLLYTNEPEWRVLRFHAVPSGLQAQQEIYVALENVDNLQVHAEIILVSRKGAESKSHTEVKLVTETQGPCYYRCPAHILEALSNPAPSRYAQEWRARCWAKVWEEEKAHAK